MAIQCAVDFNGLQIPNAYIRIDRIFGGKREGWNSVVGVYANAEAAAPVETFNASAPYVADECPFCAVYTALKTLDRFADAVDC
jgi:hypothetical protein